MNRRVVTIHTIAEDALRERERGHKNSHQFNGFLSLCPLLKGFCAIDPFSNEGQSNDGEHTQCQTRVPNFLLVSGVTRAD